MARGPATPRPISLETARRFVLRRQLLDGRPVGGNEPILEVVRRVHGLQLDPTPTVARTHLLVLWSRLGRYDPADVERLRWDERRLVEHDAFIYPVEDWPLRLSVMRRPLNLDTARGRLIRDWKAANAAMADAIIARLEQEGPLPSSAFDDTAARDWVSSGWTDRRNVSRMLEILASGGRILIGGRSGGQRIWDLPDRFLPADVSRRPTDAEPAQRELLRQALAGLGLAGRRDRGPYQPWIRPSPFEEAIGEGSVVPVAVEGWPGDRFVPADLLPELEAVERGEFEGATTLVSPFDNLIIDRERTEGLFGFRYRMELYVPPAKREYGYFVMPILHGDRLIGRVDPAFDRSRQVLVVKAIYAEPGAPMGSAPARAIRGALDDLARFLGGEAVEVEGKVPAGWRSVAG